jgi:hypothetical protein
MQAIPASHHVYGSTPRGFATLFASDDIPANALRTLESRSSYALPTSRSQSDAPTPPKHSFGVLGDRVFVGRAVYLGVDLTGRLGNYVFHNLVFDPSAARGAFEDPVSLIHACESAGAFLSDVPEELPPAVAITPEAPEPSPAVLETGLAMALLSLVLGRDAKTLPALLFGEDPHVLAFLRSAFALMPFSLRWESPFDTYSYRAATAGLAFAALPEAREFCTPLPPHSLSVNVGTGQMNEKVAIPVSPVARVICSVSADTGEREVLLSLMDLLGLGNWPEFLAQWRSATPGTREAFHAQYAPVLLRRVLDARDLVLLDAIAPVLRPADIEALAAQPEFAQALLSSAGGRSVTLRWMASRPSSPRVAALALSGDVHLLEQYLSFLSPGTTAHADALVALCRAPSGPLPDWAEGVLVGHLEYLDPATAGAERLRAIIGALRAWPGTNERSLALRSYVRLRFGDRGALDELLERTARLPGFWREASPAIAAVAAREILSRDKRPLEDALARLAPQLNDRWQTAALDEALARTLRQQPKESISEIARRLGKALDRIAPGRFPLTEDLCGHTSGGERSRWFGR